MFVHLLQQTLVNVSEVFTEQYFCCVFSTMAVLVSLFTESIFSYKGLFFYIYVSYFCIFFYLLHIVVYNTVVGIDTIIYFSMKITQDRLRAPKMFWEFEVCLKVIIWDFEL